MLRPENMATRWRPLRAKSLNHWFDVCWKRELIPTHLPPIPHSSSHLFSPSVRSPNKPTYPPLLPYPPKYLLNKPEALLQNALVHQKPRIVLSPFNFRVMYFFSPRKTRFFFQFSSLIVHPSRRLPQKGVAKGENPKNSQKKKVPKVESPRKKKSPK